MRLRATPELGADAVWFAPALDRLRALGSDPDARVRGWFAPDAPIVVGRAPGRLDVMGGIADYSGARVLQLPLDRATFALVQHQRAPRFDVVTRRDGDWLFFSLDVDLLNGSAAGEADLVAWFAGLADRWAAYVCGVALRSWRRLREAPGAARTGIRLLIDTQVPLGAGVSSSAALEVACAYAIGAAIGIDLDARELALDCQWAENHIVGAPCGIMDQMTSACGRRGRLLRLLCQPDIVEGHLAVPGGYQFYGIDSGARHSVGGDPYSRVRTAAFMGYRIIAALAGLHVERDGARVRIEDPDWRGYLANIPLADFRLAFEPLLPERMTGADFLESYGGITDRVTHVEPRQWYPVRQAAAHPIREQARVDAFAAALGALPDDAAARELGTLLRAAHGSYTACGLGSARTDRLAALVDAAGLEHGLFGARITGGGSGGTVVILGTTAAESLVREIAARNSAELGMRGDVFVGSGPGAEESGVLRLDAGEVAAILAQPSPAPS